MRRLRVTYLGLATLLLLSAVSGGTAMTAAASVHQSGCIRHVTPASQPASLRGWGSSQNKDITGQIGLDQHALAREGVQLTQWGPDWCSGKVKLYLTHYSPAAARILATAYGSEIVVSHRSMPRPPIASRSGDVTPFNGGDFIALSAAECTGGPIVELNGTTDYRMLTAGHCDNDQGSSVFRTDRNGDAGPIMGLVDSIRLCNDCIDSETVKPDSTGAHYQLRVWGGGDTSTTVYFEDGTAFPQPHNLVTQDSAFTGEITGLTVESVNQSVTFSDGITRVELTEVHGGSTIVHEGDSGGPWIQHEDGSSLVKIIGTTVGGDGEFAYYQQIGGIDSFFGVHVPTFSP